MKLSLVKEILKANVLVGDDSLDDEVLFGAAGDLMSDLLKNPREGAILLTGLINLQAVRTCVIAGMSAIVFVRGKTLSPEIISYAEEHALPILLTPYNMFSSCGKLFKNGLKSIR